MSKLSKKQIQDLMINMYPDNSKQQIQEKVKNDNSTTIRQSYEDRNLFNIDPFESKKNPFRSELRNKINKQSVIPGIDKKTIFSLLIGLISVTLFSQYFLNMVENLCIKKNISAFDINGRPKKKLLFILFLIIIIVSRIFFSFN
jgi:hypothetical protein